MQHRKIVFDCLNSIASKQWKTVNHLIKMIIEKEEEEILNFSNDELNKFAVLLCNIIITYRDHILVPENQILIKQTITMTYKLTKSIFCALAPIINDTLNKKTPEYLIEELDVSYILDFLEDYEDEVPYKLQEKFNIFKTFLEKK